MLTQALDMRGDRLGDQLLGLLAAVAGGDTAGQVGHPRPQLVGHCS